MNMSEQDPLECKHYYYNTGGGWTHWCVNSNAPCRIICSDFAPKYPRNCTHYGADGGCHEHSQKHGNVHVSIRCKAECGEPCEDFKTKNDEK